MGKKDRSFKGRGCTYVNVLASDRRKLVVGVTGTRMGHTVQGRHVPWNRLPYQEKLYDVNGDTCNFAVKNLSRGEKYEEDEKSADSLVNLFTPIPLSLSFSPSLFLHLAFHPGP